MVINIFIGNEISKKKLLSDTNKFLGIKKHIFNNKYKVFAPQNQDFVLAIYDRTIRISLIESPSLNSINYVSDYISVVFKNKTVSIRGSDINQLITRVKNVNLIKV